MGLFNFLHKKDKTADKPAAAPAAPAAHVTAQAPHAASAVHAAAPAVAPNGQLQVVIGGSPIHFSDGQPYVEGNDVFVPIRELANHLGAQVGWDANSKTATLSKDEDKIEVVVGSSNAVINGKTVAIGTAAVDKDSRIFLPIKFLADGLGAKYSYDAAGKIATISE